MRRNPKRDPNRPLDFIIFPVSLGLKLHKYKNADIADAFKMAFYCGRELNGGVIAGAKKWGVRKWLSSAGIGRKIAHSCADLWHFSGDNLVVDIYDAEREKSVLSIRKTNSSNVSKRYDRRNDRMTERDKEGEEDYIGDDNSGQARLPDTIHEVKQFLLSHEKHMSSEQAGECASDFWELNEENRWKDTNGLPLRNWKGAARAYADKWMQRNRPQHSGGGWHKQTRPRTTGGSLNDPIP